MKVNNNLSPDEIMKLWEDIGWDKCTILVNGTILFTPRLPVPELPDRPYFGPDETISRLRTDLRAKEKARANRFQSLLWLAVLLAIITGLWEAGVSGIWLWSARILACWIWFNIDSRLPGDPGMVKLKPRSSGITTM